MDEVRGLMISGYRLVEQMELHPGAEKTSQ